MRRTAYIPFIILFAIVAYYYRDFVAEDSYIVARYAENWVDKGALEYNLGEPISALTSPAHAVLEALIYWLTGATVPGWRVLGVVLVLASAGLLLVALRGALLAQLLALTLLLLSPSVVLWALGGLETPLSIFLITLLAVLVYTTPSFDSRRLYAICFVAGLAFVTRYDSITLTGPLLVVAIRRARNPQRAIRGLWLFIVLPAVWFAVAWLKYNSLMPTSYYEKTPTSVYLDDVAYTIAYLFILPLIPCWLAVAAWAGRDIVRAHLERWRWLYLCLVPVVIYGFSVATEHMLFSFRLLLPFVPVFILLLGDLTRRASEARRPRRAVMVGLLGVLVVVQMAQAQVTYSRSVNGLWWHGEYPRLGVRSYVTFMHTLERNAEDTEAHWKSLHRDGQPRITTFAAGIFPYRYRDTYIYSALISFRLRCPMVYRVTPLYSDYVHVLTPRHGTLEEQLLQPPENLELISSHTIEFDGSQETFAVYYNPHPLPHRLPAHINDPCDIFEFTPPPDE